jgi:hypothetical protein
VARLLGSFVCHNMAKGIILRHHDACGTSDRYAAESERCA